MSFVRCSDIAFMPLLVVVGTFVFNMTGYAETAQTVTPTDGVSVQAPANIPEDPALQGARKKVKDLEWEIGKAQSSLMQLSPPVRTTDSKGTTFDADKQCTYEKNRSRVDQQIRELKNEKLLWELRVNQLEQATRK